MRKIIQSLLAASCLVLLICAPTLATYASIDFDAWLKELKVEALAVGISQDILELAFRDISAPLQQVIDLDRNQPELTQTTEEYIGNRINDRLVAEGRTMMKRYPTWLRRVEERYAVPKQFITALWGIETRYGKYTGSFPTLHSLATLSYDGRRSSFFRQELLVALQILDSGRIPLKRMRGSWAGAMGQCQFMPSSFQLYAVDGDSSGRINLTSSIPDVFSSIANYLQRVGWQSDQTWGHQVALPENFDTSLSGLETPLPLTRWQNLGVKRINGTTFPMPSSVASLILPDGPEGPAYLVYDNFHTLLKWNKSNAFAIAVGILSDHLADQ
ncbi:MAG: lytic murein transglycosylase [Deltaproteobacteria bacterium]|jgi:membrane-bound lytic murein transglycosylase B|nr:lytic murein transglycosylase [Deltaproteobacteria bacterium]MCW8892295.1 lytic murein transglycosylase [Deltaproteobacteria bacterium]